jgi:hypothetical protein
MNVQIYTESNKSDEPYEPVKREINMNRHQRRALVGAIKRAKRQAVKKRLRDARRG